jgi:hypothetical protein
MMAAWTRVHAVFHHRELTVAQLFVGRVYAKRPGNGEMKPSSNLRLVFELGINGRRGVFYRIDERFLSLAVWKGLPRPRRSSAKN